MRKKKILFRFLTVFLISLIVTFYLSNKIGKSLEDFETKIYQKISGKKPQYVRYENSGLPIVVFEGNVGEQITVVMTAQEALKYYNNIENSINRRKFFVCINWLMENETKLNDSSIIYYVNFDWPSYKMKKPWRSAMSQGRAIQAFLKAFETTNDSIYLSHARKSMNTLFIEVKDGGVSYKDSLGYWYEEYADDSVPESRVLNGMIVVLQSLSEFHKVTNDPNASFLFEKGVDELKRTLHFYDNNGHSNYDILGNPATLWYQKFHIELMDFLYYKTQEPIFNQYKQKWSGYNWPSYLSRLLTKPTKIGLFSVFSIFLMVYLLISVLIFILFRKYSDFFPSK